MRNLLRQMWKEDEGTLSFEWVTLTSLLAIGVVGGMATLRDAANDELVDVAEAMTSLDQSYEISAPLQVTVHSRQGVKVRTFRPRVRTQGTPQAGDPGRQSARAGASRYVDTQPRFVRHSGGQVEEESSDLPLTPQEGDL